MKIKSKNIELKSCKLHVPIDGLIEIDNHGEVEVSDDCAEILVTQTNDWKYSDELGSGSGSQGIDDSDEEKVIREGLQKMTLDELKDVAKEAGYPEKQWIRINSEVNMINYLMRKSKTNN